MPDGFQRLSGHFEEKSLFPAVTIPTALSRLPSVPHNGLLVHETPSTFSEELIVAQLVTVFLTFWGKYTFMSVFPVLKHANPFDTHPKPSSLIHSPFQYYLSINTEVFQVVSFLWLSLKLCVYFSSLYFFWTQSVLWLGYELEQKMKIRFPARAHIFLFSMVSRALWGPPSLQANG